MRRTRTIGASLVFLFVAMVPVPAHAADVEVAIQDYVFSPDQVRVISGNVVRWTQRGAQPHTVNADDGSFDSNPIPSTAMTFGQTFTVIFTGPARTVPYYCELHGAPNGVGMAGTVVVVPPLKPPADFDGDDRTDLSVFRPAGGTWFVKDGLTSSWGTEGDIPVPGDYDGDSRTDVAVFRPSSGVWYMQGGQSIAYGTAGDIPVPADYDGDYKTDIAVFRPSNGVWYIHYASGSDAAFGWGTQGDVAVPADYDGDGKADAAVFRNGTWFIRPSSGTAHVTVNYGTAGDIPVPADYDADNTADVAVFRPAGGTWFLRHSSDGSQQAFAFGTSGDVPVSGDYNGDGVADPAVFRPANGVWFVKTGQIVPWGVGSDIPLPIPAAVRMAYFSA